MKIINLIGARPQFVKAAVVSRAIREQQGVNEVIVHTGQHFDRALSGDILDELDFPEVTYNLGINQLSHGAMTGRMLEAIEKILILERPDTMLVYGDTNSTLAGALAARKLNIRVAHVEAGMRSFNLHMPEEINRILTDRISDLLFCSSATSVRHLEKEGYGHFPCTIVNSGDVMYDAFLHFQPLAETRSDIIRKIGFNEFVLCTLHRESNVDHPEQLKAILAALDRIHTELPVVLPVHPRTQKKIDEFGIKTKIKLIAPASYFDMLVLLKHCSIVITDSGGLQKEAYFSDKPCLTVRYETEWTELVDEGYNKLVGTDPDWILNNFRWMMDNPPDFSKQLYGNGDASRTIAQHLSRTAVPALT